MITDSDRYFLNLVEQGKIEIDYQTGIVYSNLSGKRKPVGAKHSAGYLHISAGPSRQERHYILLHRLVWMTKHGEIPDGYEVNHKNGKKKENREDNLELLTRVDNVKHAIVSLNKVFGFATAKGSRYGRKKTPRDKIDEVLKLYNTETRNQSEISRRTGVKRPIVNRIIRKHCA